MEDSRLNAIKQLITFVKGRLNFSCKSTTAANVDLTESLLYNWLKNNHITLDKIYYLRSLFAFFTNFSFQIYLSTAEKIKGAFSGLHCCYGNLLCQKINSNLFTDDWVVC